jgi:hypothetical protein
LKLGDETGKQHFLVFVPVFVIFAQISNVELTRRVVPTFILEQEGAHPPTKAVLNFPGNYFHYLL